MKTKNNLFQTLIKLVLTQKESEIHYIGGADVLPPPLSVTEEKDLLNNITDANARNKLIEHNLRLVVYIAKKFENTGINIEDLISIGTIGLIKSINTEIKNHNPN